MRWEVIAVVQIPTVQSLDALTAEHRQTFAANDAFNAIKLGKGTFVRTQPRHLAALAYLIVVAAAMPGLAHANCSDRRVGGTLIGAVAGGLLGNSIAHGGGRPVGTLIGAGAGAYAGHEIAGAGCHSYARTYYRRRHYRGYR